MRVDGKSTFEYIIFKYLHYFSAHFDDEINKIISGGQVCDAK